MVIGGTIREDILKDITTNDYATIAFTLKCSEETLAKRHKKRDDTGEVLFNWLRMEPYPGDFVIDTDNKTIAQIVSEMKTVINGCNK